MLTKRAHPTYTQC